MGIIDYASPEARYYEADRAIMDDYDNRINIYNAALEKYKSQAGDYQAKVDAHNKLIEDYNAKLQDWRNKAEAYNAATAKWNETDRTVAYDPNWSGYVASPGEWFGTAPVFEGGAAPAAPSDPGFTEDDVNAFIDKAQGRAQRRGQASATAQQVISTPSQYYVTGHENFGSNPEISLAGMSGFGSDAMGFDAGGIVPPPTVTQADLDRAAARSASDEGFGLGYYIPPEVQERGRQALNLASAIDPAQGIMRGMAASGRAFDSDLPPEVRRAAAIEAGIETLAPIGIVGIGRLAGQTGKQVLLDVLTPTGAPASVADEVADPSRRAFMKGAAATAATAAVAPDVITDVATRISRNAARGTGGALAAGMRGVADLKRQMNALYDEAVLIRDDLIPTPQNNKILLDKDYADALNAQTPQRAQMDELESQAYSLGSRADSVVIDLLNQINENPAIVAEAPDQVLEDFVGSFNKMGMDDRLDDPAFDIIAQEAKARGLHTAKEDGYSLFPDIQGLIEDYYPDEFAQGGLVSLKDTAVNMFRGPQGIGAYQQYAEGGPVISEDALTQMRQKVINDYGFDPVDVAMEEGVDPALFLRVMYTENRGQQGPVSDAGAIGLMQLMPDTAAELGVDPNNPLDNARGGARYLRQQLNTFQSIPLALAAYNAGPNAVRKYNGVPPYEETRNYVAMIHGVDAGEILPSMSDFYTRVPGEDPSRKPRMRPEGLGTPGYVPAEPAQSEYLMGIGQTFMNTIQPERTPAPYIPNIMQPQEQPQEDARGIEFYRQYAAFQPPTAAG